jgi:DNA polymerase-2
MIHARGWVLDVFAGPEGVIIWFAGDDGKRLRLHQHFPVTFYATGDVKRLHELCLWLLHQPEKVKLDRNERQDIFLPDPVTVLSITVPHAASQSRLFRRTTDTFPDLTYYDGDLQTSLRYAALNNIFPLVYCEIDAGEGGALYDIRPLETRWELDPQSMSLRTLRIEPNCDPEYAAPEYLTLYLQDTSRILLLRPAKSLLVALQEVLQHYDPDVIITSWGDSWLIPYLMELSKQTKLPLSLNREPGKTLSVRPERSYYTYGQLMYKGQQQRLYGRCHIDLGNGMWDGCNIDGAIESARVSGLTLQTAARSSPGTAISSMEIITALQSQVLVPWQKQQALRYRDELERMRNDKGGMIFRPVLGFHANVGNVDFVSMYPSVMVHSNISPEVPSPTELGTSPYPPGLVPRTLAPLLDKRIVLKQRLSVFPEGDKSHETDQNRSSALKWILVTCFGYLGYKNARFGRIESHEDVSKWGREALARAKDAAEDAGFEVLHQYVDGLWIKKAGCREAADFQAVLEDITDRTHLPVGLDGVFRWIAFLPSRNNSRRAVANRYFGRFQDGTLKIRGIDLRRRDTPPYISETQLQLLQCLAQAETVDELPGLLDPLLEILRQRLKLLRAHQVELEQLLVAQKLSKELAAYRNPSPAARAAAQLQAIGKTVKPGQRVRFLLMNGNVGVHAWDLPTAVDQRNLNVERYAVLTLRAASNIFQPFGISEADLRMRVEHRVEQPSLLPPLNMEYEF